jgi:hypothetical protein
MLRIGLPGGVAMLVRWVSRWWMARLVLSRPGEYLSRLVVLRTLGGWIVATVGK